MGRALGAEGEGGEDGCCGGLIVGRGASFTCVYYFSFLAFALVAILECGVGL